MELSDWTFVVLAANPIGGLLVAIPFAILKLEYSPFRAVLLGAPLAYLQVVVVDLFWGALNQTGVWRRLVERKRSRTVERLLQSRGNFWLTLVATPLVGPWVVMAAMRYAHVPQRRVSAPILLSLALTAALLAVTCRAIPWAF